MQLQIDLTYNGTDFHDWTRQNGLHTVQRKLKTALATVLHISSISVTYTERTDTNIHAHDQITHVNVNDINPMRLKQQLDSMLADNISIHHVMETPKKFNTRFSAI